MAGIHSDCSTPEINTQHTGHGIVTVGRIVMLCLKCGLITTGPLAEVVDVAVSGGDEPGQHGVRCEASDWSAFRRRDGPVRHEAVAVQRSQRRRQAQDPCGVQERDQDLLPGGDLVHGPGQDEGNCRGLPRQGMQYAQYLISSTTLSFQA